MIKPTFKGVSRQDGKGYNDNVCKNIYSILEGNQKGADLNEITTIKFHFNLCESIAIVCEILSSLGFFDSRHGVS